MPTHVEHRSGKKPYKIVEDATGKVVGSSTSAKNAGISSWKRNQAHKKKHKR